MEIIQQEQGRTERVWDPGAALQLNRGMGQQRCTWSASRGIGATTEASGRVCF